MATVELFPPQIDPGTTSSDDQGGLNSSEGSEFDDTTQIIVIIIVGVLVVVVVVSAVVFYFRYQKSVDEAGSSPRDEMELAETIGGGTGHAVAATATSGSIAGDTQP